MIMRVIAAYTAGMRSGRMSMHELTPSRRSDPPNGHLVHKWHEAGAEGGGWLKWGG
jgi:hypothetical protein